MPTASDLLIHGHGPVVSFLVHKDDQRVAAMFAADVFNTLAYTNPRLQNKCIFFYIADGLKLNVLVELKPIEHIPLTSYLEVKSDCVQSPHI